MNKQDKWGSSSITPVVDNEDLVVLNKRILELEHDNAMLLDTLKAIQAQSYDEKAIETAQATIEKVEGRNEIKT